MRALQCEQAVAVLGNCRGVPHGFVDAQAGKPAEQEIEIEPLHQLALGAHRVEGLQQHRPQQLLGRDRGPADLRVDLAEAPVERRQSLVHQSSDRTQGMICPDAPLQVHVGRFRPAPAIVSAHPIHFRRTKPSESRIDRTPKLFPRPPSTTLVVRGTR